MTNPTVLWYKSSGYHFFILRLISHVQIGFSKLTEVQYMSSSGSTFSPSTEMSLLNNSALPDQEFKVVESNPTRRILTRSATVF